MLFLLKGKFINTENWDKLEDIYNYYFLQNKYKQTKNVDEHSRASYFWLSANWGQYCVTNPENKYKYNFPGSIQLYRHQVDGRRLVVWRSRCSCPSKGLDSSRPSKSRTADSFPPWFQENWHPQFLDLRLHRKVSFPDLNLAIVDFSWVTWQ